MLTHFAIRTGAPASPPATAISSKSIGSFIGPVNITIGAAPMTKAHGIGVLALLCLRQC